ncbi:acyl-CoA thioesterase [Halobacteria archaeon AArc-curdl1]|uniref:Acyl-CoA thioesterase n=1 Tax=Natronosalvus hydrolyticus TaxID=2979988 RepID=A0AAP3E669_9EURY|nr:acyl-CoA thioesterase [Halobacteria archaeon AArc-curdl1]
MDDSNFSVDVQVRYQDLDTLQHVNNAVYVTYFEMARTSYLDAILDIPVDAFAFVVASLSIDFKRPVTMGDDVVAAVAVTELGTSSWTMAYEIRANDDVAATGETTLVFVDPETKRPTEIPPEVRAAIIEYEGLEPSEAQ